MLQEAVIRVNVCGTLALADLTSGRGMHMTLFATGCIYEYDAAHPVSLPPSLWPTPSRFLVLPAVLQQPFVSLPVRVSLVCAHAVLSVLRGGGGPLTLRVSRGAGHRVSRR